MSRAGGIPAVQGGEDVNVKGSLASDREPAVVRVRWPSGCSGLLSQQAMP